MSAQTSKRSAPDFTLAFKQMASFVAIAKIRAAPQVLEELIQQCFVLLPSDPLSTPAQVNGAIEALFGIKLNTKEVAMVLQRLTDSGIIIELGNGQLGLAPAVETSLNERINSAKHLEQDVRATWLTTVRSGDTNLDDEKLWRALRTYLGQAFRRHGMQAVELLDPTASLQGDSRAALSTVLDTAIAKEFDLEDRAAARAAISSFFLDVGQDRKRAEYIASLADGAFNYFSLAVAPEVSEVLRGKLSALTLFLDTNFLFGILNLHVNPQVDVSSELLDAIRRFGLPFRLRYHEITARETSHTIYFFGKELNKLEWPQKISRAVVNSGALSGIEYRYHLKNAEQSVAVDDFLAPYQHWETLLKDQGIDVYNMETTPARLQARADLEADYHDYLINIQREKPDEAIQHDMAVLETVRSLRTKARSALQAGHLFVTCDYHLFRFDLEDSRKTDMLPSTVLPSLLWQILRPFVSDTEEFETAFAETFALPEFSLTRGGAQRAVARLASILASYQEIPEKTATKMLANDLLIAELRRKPDDEEFAKTVESALAKENAQLVEERAALAEQIKREQAALEGKKAELKAADEMIRQKERALAQQQDALASRAKAIEDLETEAAQQKLVAEETARRVVEEHEQKQQATAEAKRLAQAATSAQERAARTAKIFSVLLGILAVAIFELLVRFVWPWSWLLTHQNSYGLEGCIDLMLFFGILGLGVKQWRKTLWVVGVLGIVFVFLQIIGGPNPTSATH